MNEWIDWVLNSPKISLLFISSLADEGGVQEAFMIFWVVIFYLTRSKSWALRLLVVISYPGSSKPEAHPCVPWLGAESHARRKAHEARAL